jgi:hypothetical protein
MTARGEDQARERGADFGKRECGTCHTDDVKPKGSGEMAIQKIALDQLDRLSVDDVTGRLFWDGKEIVTTLSLPMIVNIALIITALAAIVAAVWPIVRFYRYGS